jgi:carboxylesterase type B
MNQTRQEESRQSAVEQAEAFLDRTRKRLSLLAALGSVHIMQRLLSTSEAIIRKQIDQLSVPKTASTDQLKHQPTMLLKQPRQSAPQPVETSLEPAGQGFTSLMPLPVLKTGTRVREEASAIWTEAQAIRHRKNNI